MREQPASPQHLPEYLARQPILKSPSTKQIPLSRDSVSKLKEAALKAPPPPPPPPSKP